jgi:hypothetical protein
MKCLLWSFLLMVSGCVFCGCQSGASPATQSAEGQPTTSPAPAQNSANADNDYIGNGAFGEPPPK